MRLMFVARSVDNVAGGVERAVTTLMNALALRDHKIEFFTWDSKSAKSFYPLSGKIVWHRLDLGNLDKKPSPGLRLKRLRKIRKIIKSSNPDLVICFQHGPFMHIKTSIMGTGIPAIVAVRNAPTRFMHIKSGRSKLVVYNFFRLAKLVVVQCESYKKLYPKFLHKRIVSISNPVSDVNYHAQPGIPGNDGKFTLLSVGRLGYQKNYSVLIDAFAQLTSSFPDWNLVIVGEGEKREELTAKIAGFGLSERILLPGVHTNIECRYRSAHCFVLTSLWEGFPNALAEALAHGLPSIGFSDCAGVNELIVHGHNGLLAEGNNCVETLVNTLHQIMESSSLRSELGARGIESIKQFSPDKIFDRWDRILTATTQ